MLVSKTKEQESKFYFVVIVFYFLKDDSINESNDEELVENSKIHDDAEKNKSDDNHDADSVSIDLSEAHHPTSVKKFKVNIK